MQDFSCGEIHLHHRVLEADVGMSSLHFEVGRKGDGVEGRDLGVVDVARSMTPRLGASSMTPVFQSKRPSLST